MAPAPRPLRDRFEEKFLEEPNSGCWLWTAAISGRQPRISHHGRGGSRALAHRVAWELYRGPIPADLHVLHRCDVPMCVNPDHLFLGTHADNMGDMSAKGRAQRGEARPSAKLTAREISEIRELRGHITQRELAIAYGVTQERISKVQNKQIWRHL